MVLDLEMDNNVKGGGNLTSDGKILRCIGGPWKKEVKMGGEGFLNF